MFGNRLFPISQSPPSRDAPLTALARTFARDIVSLSLDTASLDSISATLIHGQNGGRSGMAKRRFGAPSVFSVTCFIWRATIFRGVISMCGIAIGMSPLRFEVHS